jgi:tRNA pseudouridine13 synthase
MYKIKQIPEDFIVEEILDLKIEKEGKYSYFVLEKKNCNTVDAIRLVSKKIKSDEKLINFAGTKDRNAITRQYISVNNCPIKKDAIINQQISLKYLGQGNERINLGLNKGNKFAITVRNLEKEEKISLKKIVNYFDEQRFSKSNVVIAHSLLKRDFKKACSFIDDDNLKKFLEKNPRNFVGALRTVPKKILQMYIHAFQSKIWNETAARMIEKNSKISKKIPYSEGMFIFPGNVDKIKQQNIPLIGFGTEKNAESKIAFEILDRFDINQRDFIFKEIPEISSDGESRNLFAEVSSFKYSYENDELNRGMFKCPLEFELPKGSYATIVLRQIFQQPF